MRRIKSKDTSPELIVRKLIYKLGYRYRLHRHDLPGRPDLVFPGMGKMIFVHGCFWHQHKAPSCNIAHLPKSRLKYWLPKLRKNSRRDKLHQNKLKKLGWQYLILWECEIKNISAVKKKVTKFLSARGHKLTLAISKREKG